MQNSPKVSRFSSWCKKCARFLPAKKEAVIKLNIPLLKNAQLIFREITTWTRCCWCRYSMKIELVFSHTLNIFPVRKKIPVVQDNCYSMALSVLTVFENQQYMSHLNTSILAFFTNFCFTFKIDLSGNTVWQRVSDYQKIAKFETIFVFF